MRRVRALAVISILILPISGHASQHASGDKESFRDRFVGAWRLAWLEELGADGLVHRADCTGLLVYTADGHISVQVMYRNPKPSNNSSPVQYAQGGYEASFGRYELDDTHTFTFHVEGALVRTLLSKDLKRVYELSGNQLIVKSPDPNEHWRAAWEHYLAGPER